jgi:hypothetical protein
VALLGLQKLNSSIQGGIVEISMKRVSVHVNLGLVSFPDNCQSRLIYARTTLGLDFMFILGCLDFGSVQTLRPDMSSAKVRQACRDTSGPILLHYDEHSVRITG